MNTQSNSLISCSAYEQKKRGGRKVPNGRDYSHPELGCRDVIEVGEGEICVCENKE